MCILVAATNIRRRFGDLVGIKTPILCSAATHRPSIMQVEVAGTDDGGVGEVGGGGKGTTERSYELT